MLAVLASSAGTAGALAPSPVAVPGGAETAQAALVASADTDPAPTDSTASDAPPANAQPADSVASDAPPTNAQPTDPAPTDAQPANPAPTNPAPTDPAPTTDPAPPPTVPAAPPPTDPAVAPTVPAATPTTDPAAPPTVPAPTTVPAATPTTVPAATPTTVPAATPTTDPAATLPTDPVLTDAPPAKQLAAKPSPATPLPATPLPTEALPADETVTTDLSHVPGRTVGSVSMPQYSIVAAETPTPVSVSGAVLSPLALATPWSLFFPTQRTIAPWILLLVLALVLRLTVGAWARDVRRRRAVSSS